MASDSSRFGQGLTSRSGLSVFIHILAAPVPPSSSSISKGVVGLSRRSSIGLEAESQSTPLNPLAETGEWIEVHPMSRNKKFDKLKRTSDHI
jgi:hypothetical protein